MDDDDEEIPSDGEILSADEDEVAEPPSKKSAKGTSKMELHVSKEKATEKRYFDGLKGKRLEQLKQQNDDEDKTIKKYEKLLKLTKKGKAKESSMGKFSDGLDYLLELCTDDGVQKMYEAAKETEGLYKNKSVDDDGRKKKLKEIESKYLGDDEDFFNNMADEEFDDDEDELDDENMQQVSEDDEEMTADEDDEIGSAFDDDEDDEMGDEDSEVESDDSDDVMAKLAAAKATKKTEQKSPEVWEDIYGRTRDKEGNVVKQEATKYVPPHLRNDAGSSMNSEKLNNLRRQIKGYINRLAESNLHRISIDIETLFNENARHDVNLCLMEIIFDSLVTSVISKERPVLENMLLISVLHANIGSEIGAYFLEKLVIAVKEQLDQIKSLPVEDKKCDNLILVICHLFTFKVVSYNIVYEMLDELCTKICEKSIDCIILILKSVGILLRKDEPLRLKEFIMKVQSTVSSDKISEEHKSRQSFMFDILMAVKNNNISKIPNFDQELLEHFRKLQKQFIRPGQYVSSLTVTMNDIMNADTNGRWWLVGSAWLQKGALQASAVKETKESTGKVVNEDQKKIFELARKHKMNTDEKRNIFYILMSSEDYLDAYEKIVSSSKNERVVVAVIIHCLTSEKTYNPYYNFITQQLCEHNRKYVLTFQYALWDRIKDLKDSSTRQTNNLSQFICFLITSGMLPLSVLKIIEFEQMESVYVKFLRKVMHGILLIDEEKFHTIFQRISPVKKLKPFKDQLRLFLKIFLINGKTPENFSKAQIERLNERLSLADKYLIAKSLS